MIDPLAEFDIDVRFFDIPRLISVYSDNAGINWWTKAWFNNREVGESSVTISYEIAKDFIEDKITKQQMLEQYYPEQMKSYYSAMEKAREQIITTVKQTENQISYK